MDYWLFIYVAANNGSRKIFYYILNDVPSKWLYSPETVSNDIKEILTSKCFDCYLPFQKYGIWWPCFNAGNSGRRFRFLKTEKETCCLKMYAENFSPNNAIGQKRDYRQTDCLLWPVDRLVCWWPWSLMGKHPCSLFSLWNTLRNPNHDVYFYANSVWRSKGTLYY